MDEIQQLSDRVEKARALCAKAELLWSKKKVRKGTVDHCWAQFFALRRALKARTKEALPTS